MKKYVAEFIGTFFLVVFGCGSAVGINSLLVSSGQVVPLAISTLTIAFVIVAMANSIGKVSGCHINPAVSLGVWMNNKMSTKDFCAYVVSQIIGGIAGAGVLAYLFNSTKSLGANGYGDFRALGCSMGVAIVIEVILTFAFVLTVLSITDKAEDGKVASFVIGLTLTLVHILGVPFTGTSVNPARSLGPALIQGGEALSQVWVFILAPLVGAALAAIVFKVLISDQKKEKAK